LIVSEIGNRLKMKLTIQWQ